MKLLINLSILMTSIMSMAMAEEHAAEHHAEPSVFDLKYSALNFVILFGFLGWKLKKPLSEMFNKKADEVKSMMNSAAEQSKDAQEKLNTFHTKMKNIDSELVKISAEYDTDTVSFAKNLHEETQMAIARMKRDLQSKLEGEKKEMIDEMNHEMVSGLIAKTKNDIANNADKRKSTTSKLMTGLN